MAQQRLKQHISKSQPGAADSFDRVFVHDLVLDVEIGVYTHEKGVAQRVRFSVDVDLIPARQALDDDIDRAFDYDTIIKGIKASVERGHINLVETLAEEVARRCLAHPRAARVTVKIEKLDKEPGGVGVEIVRSKAGVIVPSRTVSAHARLAPVSDDVLPVVVKLGGSVVRSGELAAWLDAIAASSRPVVVVPGGGALADEVRACQARLGFGDRAAHRMALLAMDQLAWAVAGLRQGFEVGATEVELRAALRRGEVAVWAPYALISERSDIEHSWRLTSDSLALWLAGRLGAPRCYLIKSIARKGTSASARQLAQDGVVDAAFPEMLKETGVAAALLGRGDQRAFAAWFAEQTESCGAEIH